MLWLDFETRSECDLPARGAYNYARDPSTKVLCMAWALDDGEVEIWAPGQEFPKAVADAVANGDTIMAHNAAFERLIWAYVLGPDHGVPVPRLEQFYCTAAQARANCAPGSLEDVGRFAGADMRKDHKGAALVRKCCCPPFKHTEQDLADLFAYCAQDVRAMRAVSKSLRPLSAQELADYHVGERINDRGVLVDVALAKAATEYAVTEMKALEQVVQNATKGKVLTARSTALVHWVYKNVGPDIQELMKTHKAGHSTLSLDTTVRRTILDSRYRTGQVPPDVETAVQAVDDMRASSTAKFQRMADLADVEDHRVRGAFVFAGGAATGRASSYGLQVHNFPRKCAEDPVALRKSMCRGAKLTPTYGKRVTDVLKGMLRPALIPAPGKVFVVADWNAIEGRVNPWLAKSAAGETKLDIYRSNLEPYVVNASIVFGLPYEEIWAGYEAGDKRMSDMRQQGKVMELALGFAGGIGAFAAMSRIYGVTLPEPEAKRMINIWRRANPWATRFWSDLEHAYMGAMRRKGEGFMAGRITYYFDGTHLWYALPSGRILCYPYARLDAEGISYAKASWKPAADAKEWPRARLWPGLACENVTQAAAHDLLRHSLRALPEAVLHVHDEVVCETDDPERATELMKRVMQSPPEWAAGLPLSISIKTMERYGK